jgi:hypothetical protein
MKVIHCSFNVHSILFILFGPCLKSTKTLKKKCPRPPPPTLYRYRFPLIFILRFEYNYKFLSALSFRKIKKDSDFCKI